MQDTTNKMKSGIEPVRGHVQLVTCTEAALDGSGRVMASCDAKEPIRR